MSNRWVEINCNLRLCRKVFAILKQKNPRQLPDKIKDKEFLAPSIIIIGKIVEFKVNNNITKVSDVYLPDINKVQLYNKSQK